MQLEDKVLEDRDAAHAESQQREDVEAYGEDRLPEPVTEALDGAAVEHRGKLLGAIRMILDRQRIEVSDFHMPRREAGALEALQVAVDGKSSDLYQFVYASDRRDLLERALGVLQPNLTRADDRSARELHTQFADLSDRVAQLRHDLTSLEDSQDELLETHQKEALAATATPGDKPKPKPGTTDPDAPRPPTTLTGPELPPEGPVATTLIGPELPPQAPVATTLSGPELPPQAPVATTLTGPELPPVAPVATTLTGPDVGDTLEPRPPSTLGDATDVAGTKPWWRKPFG